MWCKAISRGKAEKCGLSAQASSYYQSSFVDKVGNASRDAIFSTIVRVPQVRMREAFYIRVY